jgi:hypothetical protein
MIVQQEVLRGATTFFLRKFFISLQKKTFLSKTFSCNVDDENLRENVENERIFERKFFILDFMDFLPLFLTIVLVPENFLASGNTPTMHNIL